MRHFPTRWGEGRPADPSIFVYFEGPGARSREAVATRKLGGCEASCERRRDACSTHQCFKCIQGMSMIALLQFQRNQIAKLIFRYVWSRVRCEMKWNIKQSPLITPVFSWHSSRKVQACYAKWNCTWSLGSIGWGKKISMKTVPKFDKQLYILHCNQHVPSSSSLLPPSLSLFWEILCTHGWLPVYRDFSEFALNKGADCFPFTLPWGQGGQFSTQGCGPKTSCWRCSGSECGTGTFGFRSTLAEAQWQEKGSRYHAMWVVAELHYQPSAAGFFQVLLLFVMNCPKDL